MAQRGGYNECFRRRIHGMAQGYTRRASYFKRTCQCTRVREEGCRGIDMVRHKGDGTRRASDLEENL